MPEDYHPEPDGFLSTVTDPDVRRWALAVHALWPQLCRKVCAHSASSSTLAWNCLPLKAA